VAGPPENPVRHEPGPQTSVLLAEHEPEVAEMSARYLRQDGLRVRLVTSPEPTLAALTAGPDAVAGGPGQLNTVAGGRGQLNTVAGGPGQLDAVAVIDLTMPDLDPRRIRQALRTPVIFLVADARAPRPRGLAVRGDAAGARRWLARPFSPRQLVALVREVLRNPGATPPGDPPGPRLAYRSLGGLRLDGGKRAAVADGRHVPLTATEFAVLAVMLDNPGRVVSRRQLLAAAGRQAAGDRAADVYIAQLRAKLGQAVRIRTVRGTGYALDP
jgi:DNA-binding response OmpR family regulator